MDKVLVTGRSLDQESIPGIYDRQAYNAREFEAAAQAGFEVVEVPFYDVILEQAEDHDLEDKAVFLRHSANQDFFFQLYVAKQGGWLLVPNAEQANEWYKVVPNDEDAPRWLGGRTVNWVAIPAADDIDIEGGAGQPDVGTIAAEIADTIFSEAAEGRVFVKGRDKSKIITPAVHDKGSVREAVRRHMVYRGKPNELIYSEPMEIASQPRLVLPNEEYRCLVVDDSCSTTSLTTNLRRQRRYDEFEAFANDFATAFRGRLPHAYALDVARLATGELAVVELNDIGGSGFSADHDIHKFYRDVYASG